MTPLIRRWNSKSQKGITLHTRVCQAGLQVTWGVKKKPSTTSHNVYKTQKKCGVKLLKTGTRETLGNNPIDIDIITLLGHKVSVIIKSAVKL